MMFTDAFLSSFLDLLPSTKYTVVYTTSPVASQHHHLVDETELYEMDPTFASPAHMELKRDFSVYKRNTSDGNITLPAGPLFERYQFFGPGTPLHYTPKIIVSRSLTPVRSLHGYCRHNPTAHDSLRCYFRCLEFTGILRCL